MSRRAAAILLGSVFFLAIATLVLRRGGPASRDGNQEAPIASEAPKTPVPVDLYFPDAAGRLSVEQHEIVVGHDTGDRLRAILERLLVGPDAADHFAPLPPPIEVGGIHITAAGTAYVDLVSTEHALPPVTGTHDELMTVYSLVNSLLLNTPDVRAIVLLWNGQQLESFAGHIDTTRPLVANPDL